MSLNVDISNSSSRIPSRLIVIAGTYDGVLAGWDTAAANNKTIVQDVSDVNDNKFDDQKLELQLLRRKGCDGKHLKLIFAMAAHEGSVRCLDIAGGAAPAPSEPFPKTLLSGGYDETINVYNLYKRSQEGELKTPNDLGSPLCCSFAPPSSSFSNSNSDSVTISTHAMVGTTSGKIILYKNNKDWSIEHVLSGHHPTEVSCLAVHPTGKMALSGGRSDGKLILWDLMKGRLAYVHKIVLPPSSKRRKENTTINHIIWSGDGMRYAYCYGTKITVKDATSGDDLLDVDMPGRVNQLAFIGGQEGMFVAAACDDGGLPVLEVGHVAGDSYDNDGYGSDAEAGSSSRRAIMAIEPVDTVVAGDDRFKCIRSVEGGSGFLVVIANSGGVVSLMDLEGAVRMMLTTPVSARGGDGNGEDSMSSDDDDDDDNELVEAAVEILDSVRIGSGARITDLTVWSLGGDNVGYDDAEGGTASGNDDKDANNTACKDDKHPVTKKRKGGDIRKNFVDRNKIELDDEAVEKARRLVSQAKKHQKRKKKQKTELSTTK